MKLLCAVSLVAVLLAACNSTGTPDAATDSIPVATTDPPVSTTQLAACDPATAASATASFLTLLTADPAAAEEIVADDAFGFFEIDDDLAPRLSNDAFDRETLGAYLAGPFTVVERIDLLTMIVVGDVSYHGYQLNLSLVRHAAGADPAKWDGYTVYDCDQARLAAVRLRYNGPPTPIEDIPPAAEMCPLLGGQVLEGVPYEACWLEI